MRKYLLFASLALLTFAAPCYSQNAGDTLIRCLGDATSGKDRKDLARWVFVAIAVHPEMQDISNVSADTADVTSRAMAAILTRLLTEACPNEVKNAVRSEGRQVMRRAFEALGGLAMMELTTNKEVTTALTKFERYIDRAKVNAVIEER